MFDKTLRLLLASSLLSGCVLSAGDQAPVMYPFSEMRRIAILPVVDSRADKKEKIDFRKIQKYSMEILSERRYLPVASDQGVNALEGLNEDDLKKASPELLKLLGPESERWVLVVWVGDVASKRTFGSSANAQVFGFLFDKERGKVAWSDTGTGHAVSGGLAGMMLKSSTREEAVGMAILRMLEAFPKLPKAAK